MEDINQDEQPDLTVLGEGKVRSGTFTSERQWDATFMTTRSEPWPIDL